MNLEEDAMLVAIGQMSMDEAREKWADQWSEFCQSLSRWKSIHQLLRLARLNAVKQKLAEAAASEAANSKILLGTIQNLQNEQMELEKEIEWQAGFIIDAQIAAKRATEKFRRKGQPEELAFGYNPEISEEAPKTHRGKKIYQDHVRYAIDAATMNVQAQLAGGEAAIAKIQQEQDANRAKLSQKILELNKSQEQLVEYKTRLAQVQDQYDITKPYAMGLLVADIFYSLAAALQGDIY